MIDSLSSGERTGNSLNRCDCKHCGVYTSGLWDLSWEYAVAPVREVGEKENRSGKPGHRG